MKTCHGNVTISNCAHQHFDNKELIMSLLCSYDLSDFAGTLFLLLRTSTAKNNSLNFSWSLYNTLILLPINVNRD